MDPTLRLFAVLGFQALAPLWAGVPNALIHSIPAPPSGFQSNGRLGTSVAVSEAYIAVGEPWEDTAGSFAGMVKVFDSTTGALRFVLPNPHEVGSSSPYFGASVAISGATLVVGTSHPVSGRVSIYNLEGATPTVPITMLTQPESDTIARHFGVSVSISGTLVAVGAPPVDQTHTDDTGSVYVYDLSGTTPTAPVAVLNKPLPSRGGENFGVSVGLSGNRVVVGAPGVSVAPHGDFVGAAYVYDLTTPTPAVPVAILPNPSPAGLDFFGNAVAIAGSGVVVRAPGDDSVATNAGSVYYFDLSGENPTAPRYQFEVPPAEAGDELGSVVAMSETRVVIGAPGLAAGAAYLFDTSSSTPTVPVATFPNPAPAVGDKFGFAVAVNGTNVIIGAPQDDLGAEDAGTAYAYDVSAGPPTEPSSIMNRPSPMPDDHFGSSVALSGTRLISGSPSDDAAGTDAGSAYVFDFASATPTTAMLALPNPTPMAGDLFGAAVAISGSHAVVGAPEDSTLAPGLGSVYVYPLASPASVITVPNPVTNGNGTDSFGAAVAIDGHRLVVGAPDDDTGFLDAGSIYVFDLGSATPTVPILTINSTPDPEGAPSYKFGAAVAISGTRIAVGAPWDEFGARQAGRVFVYDLSQPNANVPVAILNNPSPGEGDNFGASVAISGTRLVIGAPFDDEGAADAGSAYVYNLTHPTPTIPVRSLANPTPGTEDKFGTAVAMAGAQVVVSAPQNNAAGVRPGSVYVYDIDAAAANQPAATLNHPMPSPFATFGGAVAIDGTTIAVGTPRDDSPQIDKGSVFIFGSTATPPDADQDGLADAWELTYWPTLDGHAALDDADHDGTPELLELAFGLNPTVPDPAGVPTATNEGGFLTITLTKHPGVNYQVQSAGTLLPEQPDSFSATTTFVHVDDATTLKVSDTVLIGAAPARFLRVRVTSAP